MRMVVLSIAVCAALPELGAESTAPRHPVPGLVRIVNTFRPANGLALSPVETVTFSIYAEKEEGAPPLWSETQNIAVEPDGRYVAILGATAPEGLPADLFSSGDARWLGVRFHRSGETDLPRTALISVPYALKAGDAATLGGRPASDYLLAGSGPADPACATSPAPLHRPPAPAPGPAHTGGLKPNASAGASGYIAQFVSSSDLGNSSLFQAAGKLGIGTTTPAFAVDIFSSAANATAAVRVGNGTADNRVRVESNAPYALGMKTGVNGTYAWMGVTTGGHYQFSDQNGTALLTLQQGGNTGIGTTAPASKLDVAGDINLSGSLRFRGAAALWINATAGNVAAGANSLVQNTTGTNNTALGHTVLAFNSTGWQNTGVGGYALFFNTTGNANSAVGYGALQSNTTGSHSTAVGYGALAAASGVGLNTAVGAYALGSDSTGQSNTAAGYSSLWENTTGSQNTAAGFNALYSNTSGSTNTALGYNALYLNTLGINNIALGYQAGYFVSGAHNNNIHIGNAGNASDNAVIRIGTPGTQTAFVAAGIRSVTTARNDAIPVVIDSAGQLGTISSSRRFKEDIRGMGDSSKGLLHLRPVTFRYREPFADGSKPIQYGLIAEEVAEIYPELIARSADGQIETVKYQALDALLIRELQRQDARLRRLEQELRKQQRQNHELRGRLQQRERSSAAARRPALK